MNIKLRQLINRLEELSNGGRNDNMDVLCWSESTGDTYDMNELGDAIKTVKINKFCTSNEMYDYVEIVTE